MSLIGNPGNFRYHLCPLDESVQACLI